MTLTLALAGLAAGCSAHAQVANLMHDSWNVIKEYDQDGYTYYVVQEGYRYTKIVQLPSGPVYTLYEVDTLTRYCKWGDVLVGCAGLRGDSDLAPYISWLPPLPAGAPAAVPPEPAPPPPGAWPVPKAPPAKRPAAESGGENPFVLPEGRPRPKGRPSGKPVPAPPEPLDETW